MTHSTNTGSWEKYVAGYPFPEMNTHATACECRVQPTLVVCDGHAAMVTR